MHATVLMSSGPARRALGLRRAAPRAGATPGLRYSAVATAAPLGTGVPPERSVGTWPGLPDDLPSTAAPLHDGPTLVITIGRLRLLQAPRFFRAGAKAERHILASPGLTWASGLAAPERRTLFTVSWWHDHEAMDATVRGAGDHRRAVEQQAEKDFHHDSAFIRFRPIAAVGSLTGRNGVEHLSV